MVGLLMTCGIVSFIISGASVLMVPQGGLTYVILWFFAGAFFMGLSAMLDELRAIRKNLVKGVCDPLKVLLGDHHEGEVGGEHHVVDPEFGKKVPAPDDVADIWPDVTDPALRREIIRKAKDTGAAHVMVNGLTYKVEFKK